MLNVWCMVCCDCNETTDRFAETVVVVDVDADADIVVIVVVATVLKLR